VSSHYVFSRLLVNNTETPNWKYIRDVGKQEGYRGGYSGPGNDEFGKTAPNMGHLKDGTDYALRCGLDAEKSAAKTETATILAGSEVGFRIGLHISAAFRTIGHPGPAQVYMHRTDDLVNDVGDGDWFKIAYEGPINDTFWGTWVAPSTEVNFTIPATTPPGTYLLRMEQFMPHTEFGYSQWYVNCAHINVVGPGGGVPGPLVKIPQVYREDDPGIWLQNGMDQTLGLSKYVPPGPPVWVG